MSAGANVSLISIGLGVLAIAAGAPDAGVALIGSGQQFGLLTVFKHTRTEESAADQKAVTYLEATRQSGQGLIDFFEKYRYQEVMSTQRQMPYFRSHPLSADRISALRRRVEESKNSALPQTPRAEDQLARMKAKLDGFLSPYSRVYRDYPESDKSIPARYARAIAAYRVPDLGTAMREINGLLELEPDNPYFHELKGQILFENGKAEDSVAPHRRSVELAPRQPLLKVNLARSLTEVGGDAALAEAEGLLVDALALERDNAFAWDQLARVYAAQNKIGDADLATSEAAYAIGDLRRAYVFARRAQDKLDPQTPNGRRASDISAITDPRAQRSRG